MDRCHMFLRLPKRSDLRLCLICSRDVLLFFGCRILSQCLLQGTSFSLNLLLRTGHPKETHAVVLRLEQQNRRFRCFTSRHVRGTRQTVAARFSKIFQHRSTRLLSDKYFFGQTFYMHALFLPYDFRYTYETMTRETLNQMRITVV